jgi:ArsR family transcriptional regulator
MELVDVLKALADETRLRIMNVLRQESLCVCDLEAVLKLSQSNASRHLTKLRHCRLIVAEKQAQWVYYRINEKLLQEQPFVQAILEQEMGKNTKYQQDLSMLRQYRNQGGGCGYTDKII